ncbi:TatD family deoxyribonuclease [Bacteroidetes/Chlorobi group bacterium Naka2016]|jgi:TatD DNase family protein|nr:MAG: TatD family deoxyribonuclease [Bacteroidetes/Chlorobi group bacterium Naka2016]
MIDTHCHLDSKEFENDREEVIRRAFEGGIVSIIVPSIDTSNLEKVVKLAEENERIFSGVGIHPHNAKEYNNQIEEKICKLIEEKNKKIVAIGEIGLDYYYDFAPKEKQKEVFRRQLQIAKEYQLPAIIHNRDSNEDLLDILEQEQDGSLRFVLHCFSQDREFLSKTLELGAFVSFTGNVTFKNNKFASVVEEVPEDRFFLETDSPFMTPVPHRGKRNEPSFVRLVAQKIAEIKNLPINKVIEMTTNNAKKFFQILLIALIIIMPIALRAEEEEEADFENPYKKFIGVSSNFGFNTLVVFQTWKEDGASKERNSAYEGKFFWGFNLNLSPVDFNINRLEFTYTLDRRYNDTAYPDLAYIYRTLSFTSLFLINPSMRVNFYGALGLTYIFNSFNLGHPYRDFKSSLGANFGAGFLVNIPIQNVGLFTINGEWLMIFDLSNYKDIYDVELKRNVDAYYYYSQPRLIITWYPEFLNKLR